MRVTVNAPAKINLTLDILGKRNDGYHLVKMLMQSVSVCDTVTVWDGEENSCSVFCDLNGFPSTEVNTAKSAVTEFFAHSQLQNPGIGVKIEKQIPVAAGLAGGSTDAAAVLVALNHLTGAALSQSELCEIGARVGADVPFCIVGGTMVASGIGTILTPAPDIPECYFVLAKPPISVSTKEAYALTGERGFWERPSTDQMVEAICEADLQKIGMSLYNEFENVLALHEVAKIKQIMLECGALGACMSGSGPTVFGVFTAKNMAENCSHVLQSTYDEVFVCRPLFEGCKIME